MSISENRRIRESDIVLSTFFLFSFQEKRKAKRKQEKIKGHRKRPEKKIEWKWIL